MAMELKLQDYVNEIISRRKKMLELSAGYDSECLEENVTNRKSQTKHLNRMQ